MNDISTGFFRRSDTKKIILIIMKFKNYNALNIARVLTHYRMVKIPPLIPLELTDLL
jgi:hypothetical protein